MQRDLVANNVFVFTSDLYAQVTASVILSSAGAVVIDTLPYPVETRQLIRFVEERHRVPVRYVINTHYHADHTYGTCFFERAQVVSHSLCRDLLDTRGRAALESQRRAYREMSRLRLRLPDMVFDGDRTTLAMGDFTLEMWHSPGHSPDSITVHLLEQKVLFAADTVMPIPFFADGSWGDLVASLERLSGRDFDAIVQGHGDVVLRGEVEDKISADLAYLRTLREMLGEVVASGGSLEDALAQVDIEACGKSRITLNGLGEQLHASNVRCLYEELSDPNQQAA